MRLTHGAAPADAWAAYYQLTVVAMATHRSQRWKLAHARRFNNAALLGWSELLTEGLSSIKEKIKEGDEWGAGCAPTVKDVAAVATIPVPLPDGRFRTFYQHAHLNAFSLIEKDVAESVLIDDDYEPTTPFGEVRRSILRRRAHATENAAVNAELNETTRARPTGGGGGGGNGGGDGGGAGGGKPKGRDSKARAAGVTNDPDDDVDDAVAAPATAPEAKAEPLALSGTFKNKDELLRAARAAGVDECACRASPLRHRGLDTDGRR